MYKGTNWTRGELGHEIDRNPLVPCDDCGEEYRWQDYWQKNLDEITPETTFRCKDCYNHLIEQARIDRRRERNQSIGEFA